MAHDSRSVLCSGGIFGDECDWVLSYQGWQGWQAGGGEGGGERDGDARGL